MEIVILGLPQSGKSTLFQIMTGINPADHYGEQVVIGNAFVPDARFDTLVKIFNPKKVSPASVPFTDLMITGDNPWAEIRQKAGNADGILHIIDGFTSSGASEAASKYRKLADELVFSDLVMVENRLERLKKIPQNLLKGDEAVQAKILPAVKTHLEDGKPLRDMDLAPAEVQALKGFCFWSLKPELVVINTLDTDTAAAESFSTEAKVGSPAVSISCKVEAEISQIPMDERAEFLLAMGIDKPAFELIIQKSFSLMGRISYFTVGEDEVKAWVIPANSTAPKAASAIHKDFERGFIKAEVVSYEDFISCGKTLASAKSAGKMRLEGKEYIVKDGDIISFRFNV